jgi:outer membrane protein OmpA-like peptidoglycan-associated protein
MKTLGRYILSALPLLALMAGSTDLNAQLLKKLGQKAEKAAERTIERRVERETEKKTDAAMDSILEPGSGKKNTPKTAPVGEAPSETANEPENTGNSKANTTPKNVSESISVYSKFDFVPGDKLLFFDDFSADYIGDFPSKWDTNGSGEVVAIGENSEKWFEIKSNSTYFPNISDLPEDYTIEFDLLTMGLGSNTSSQAKLGVSLNDDNSFDWYKSGKNAASVQLPVGQYAAFDIAVWNKINNETTINNRVQADVRTAVLNQPHIAIAVNGQRFRLWVNETKYVDVPKLVADNALDYLRFEPSTLADGEERLFIKNLKIAAGGVDLRKKLMAEGRVTTNGILFDVGSATIQPRSMGIIRQISQVMQEENALKLKIVGHTDADGGDAANLELSKKRADAIKNALTNTYGISGDRLLTEGKGESVPVGDNTTAEGKAQNRRVEFIKQ